MLNVFDCLIELCLGNSIDHGMVCRSHFSQTYRCLNEVRGLWNNCLPLKIYFQICVVEFFILQAENSIVLSILQSLKFE